MNGTKKTATSYIHRTLDRYSMGKLNWSLFYIQKGPISLPRTVVCENFFERISTDKVPNRNVGTPHKTTLFVFAHYLFVFHFWMPPYKIFTTAPLHTLYWPWSYQNQKVILIIRIDFKKKHKNDEAQKSEINSDLSHFYRHFAYNYY